MKMFRHLLENPFISATGFAALIHSTWSLGTLFAGEQPEGLHVVGWIVPALLIAFALDIGQIVTSHEIRVYGLTRSRGVTFLVFACATYYLQWLYIVHHMPALELSAGISPVAQHSARYLRDAALWIIPALLPLSTLLYTLSSDKSSSPSPSDVSVTDSVTDASEGEVEIEIRPTLPGSGMNYLHEPGGRDNTKITLPNNVHTGSACPLGLHQTSKQTRSAGRKEIAS